MIENPEVMKNAIKESTKYWDNDVYKKFWLEFSDPTIGHVQCNLVYPLTENYLKKYSASQVYLV